MVFVIGGGTIYIYILYIIIKGYEEMYLDIYDIDVENPWVLDNDLHMMEVPHLAKFTGG